jgi:polyvinyl alcohol dehydrogenase (cytochrome)
VLIAGQKSGHVHALDPDQDGKVLWVNRVSRGSALGGIHWGMASDGARAYAPIADLPWAVTKEILPRQQSQPGVVALDTLTGEILWRDQAPGIACRGDDPTCLRANSGAPTAIEGAVFSGSIDGHIRAYAADTGKVLWEFATDREFDAVNGVPAHGGSVDGPGPVIADGQVFVLSGYTTNIFNPGNVIIAFGIQ